MTKNCSGCSRDLSLDCFSFKDKAKGKLQSKCKDCYKEYRKGHYPAYYEQKKSEYRARAKKWHKETKADHQEKIMSYLLEHPCIHCGESDPVVLDFDHRDPSEKIDSIAMLLRATRPWRIIEAEIKKCDVLCANCHRRRTAHQFGWYRLRVSGEEV